VPANVPYGKTVDAESVILAVVAPEAVIWNTVSVVTTTLLPGAVFRLPAPRTIVLPRNLLTVRLIWSPLLCRTRLARVSLLTLLFLALAVARLGLGVVVARVAVGLVAPWRFVVLLDWPCLAAAALSVDF
jgi:hypothetical protein